MFGCLLNLAALYMIVFYKRITYKKSDKLFNVTAKSEILWMKRTGIANIKSVKTLKGLGLSIGHFD